MKKILPVLLALCLTLGCPLAAYANPFQADQVKEYGDITNYQFADGSVGVEITGEPAVFWIQTSIGNEAVWFGFDNTNRILPEGSLVTVKLIDRVEDPALWETYYNQMDISRIEDDSHHYLCLCECRDASGLVLRTLRGEDLTVYAQLSSDWDPENLHTVFPFDGPDESVPVTYVPIGSMISAPVDGHFARLNLKHMSTFYLYAPDLSSGFPASILSGGSIAILAGSAAILIGCGVIIWKKKKTRRSDGAKEE